MHVARQLHDSLDYLSFDDERRQLGLLITAFIRKMSFGRDLEARTSPATPAGGGCNHRGQRLQPWVVEAAALCVGAASPM